MAITTSGGTGSATGTFTNSTSAASTTGGGTISVFTTPNTANAIFIVNYQVVLSTANTSNLTDAIVTVPGIVGYGTGANSNPPVIRIDGSGERSGASGTFKCGPNTALSLAVTCKNAGSASAATFGYRVQYDYVSIVIS